MHVQAIILKKIPLREHDELVICYTKHAGKQAYQAKSIRRPTSKQSRHIDVLNHVECNLIESMTHPIMASASCINAFRTIKADLSAVASAYFIAECFDKLVYEGDADEHLWNYLQRVLNAYNEPQTRDWTAQTQKDYGELLTLMGYNTSTSVEDLMHGHFYSLEFLRHVMGMVLS